MHSFEATQDPTRSVELRLARAKRAALIFSITQSNVESPSANCLAGRAFSRLLQANETA